MSPTPLVAPVPRYVELAPAGSTPVAGTAGALLRSYLGILAFHLQQPGADYSPAAIGAALSTLPGLLTQAAEQTREAISVPLTSTAGGLAAVLAGQWGAVANSPNLLSLVRPMVASRAYEAMLIVLRRPADDVPLLESAMLSVNLQQDQAPPGQQPSSATLSITCRRTSCTVRDDTLASSLAFVADLSRQGLIADLATTRGYVAIPLS